MGACFTKGETFGVVESVKAASDLYMPVGAEVVEINDAVDADPALVNQEAFSGGWLLKIRIVDEAELTGLMQSSAYAEII